MTATMYKPTLSEYIIHHLGHFTTQYQNKIIDFSIINLDTLFWSIFCGIFSCLLMYYAARITSSNTPGRFLALIEIMVEMIENQSKIIVQGDRRLIAPLALVIFIWISLMNALDFLPIDLIFGIRYLFGLDIIYHRIVPTADLNSTLGIALGILTLMLYYNFKIKGFIGFMYELLVIPFGIWLAPFNLLLNIIEHIAKTVSLSMRLFGNMYASELLFLLIALLSSSTTVLGFIAHIIAGSVWTIFHIFVVFLQAFIFMTLTLIYLGQAHEIHK